MLGIAATAALRVGVAAAMAERDRRAAESRRRRARQFALLPGEPPPQGLRRMILSQFDVAVELLGADNGAMPTAEAVHETRKTLKRLRTLMRLLEGELGAEATAREQLLLREAGRRLAGARDAEVILGTLEALQRRHPRKLARRRGVARLHQQLLAERERATGRLLGDEAARAQVIADLRAARMRIAAWAPSEAVGLGSLEPALRRIYGEGRRRQVRAQRRRKRRAVEMHRWRKRVKDLRYASEALSHRDPDAEMHAGATALKALAPNRKQRPTREQPQPIPKLARRADALGELLGEEHDLFLLAQRVREGGRWGRGTRRELLKLIERRRRRLTKRALRDG
ncbi:MAG TPA: CHAD domain-containing protein, partial [Solirubrobacteraceae bacterium]|nr:CHAD domain-containing protein [Solirubrobacteraceae bacterium]